MAVLFAFASSLVGAFFLERFSKPKADSVFNRPLLAILISSLLVLSLFLLAFLITRRPLFAASLSMLGMAVVVVINNTKFKTLREPLVFSDFFLYLQAIKHPRLYLPFLGVAPLVAIIIMILLIVSFGFYFEETSHHLFSWASLIIACLLSSCVIALNSLAKRLEIQTDVNEDYQKLGLLAGLCCYGAQAGQQRESLQAVINAHSLFQSSDESVASNQAKSLADIVVVQSESFFDARVLSKFIKPTVLSEYDKCLSESIINGQLEVPAWGANTMRTEFAFLSSLNPQKLGLAQFYPYQQLMTVTLPSIVSELKAKGYRCICIHPNAASFFMRDSFFQKLGFDEFIDADAFTDAERVGPYVSDLAVSDKIKEVLSQSCQPCFVYTITMENHGPLHLESVQENEWKDYFIEQPNKALTDLVVYLRHLNNADEMIKQQLDFFKGRERETLFAFYGDHVPAISHVFEAFDYNDPRSNYFIWSSENAKAKNNKTTEMKAESLARRVVDLADMLT